MTPGQKAKYPNPAYVVNGECFDSRLVENASFVRLKGVTLSYSLGKNAINKLGGVLTGVRFFVTGRNLLTRTKYSGWDPEHPYKDRDPRFYHDIVFDGFHYVLSLDDLSPEQKKLEYCDLFTNGAMRDIDHGSSTGYFIQKLVPHQCNKGDKYYEWDWQFQSYVPYMRLADVYLMYAEAKAAIATSASDLNDRPTYCPTMSAPRDQGPRILLR